MKKILFTVLTILSASALYAQDPQEPCCSVIGINPASLKVIVMNTTSGLLFSFTATQADIENIRLKDKVTTNANASLITAVNGVTKKYKSEPLNVKIHFAEPVNGLVNPAVATNTKNTNLKPVGVVTINYAEPCCAIVKIENIEPCCNLVTAKDKISGAVYSFKAPRDVLKTADIGDPVFSEPVNGLAIIQSAYLSNNGELNSFGYPIESGEEGDIHQKWIIRPVSTMKGVLGKLNTRFDPGVEWSIEIRTTDDKFITSRSSYSNHGNSYDLSPGVYIFELNTIKVYDVPIEKGKETRLKAGVLSIVSEGDWELRSEDKKKFHTSGNKPKKIALPVGSYQLMLGTQLYPLVIEDGKTVEM